MLRRAAPTLSDIEKFFDDLLLPSAMQWFQTSARDDFIRYLIRLQTKRPDAVANKILCVRLRRLLDKGFFSRRYIAGLVNLIIEDIQSDGAQLFSAVSDADLKGLVKKFQDRVSESAQVTHTGNDSRVKARWMVSDAVDQYESAQYILAEKRARQAMVLLDAFPETHQDRDLINQCKSLIVRIYLAKSLSCYLAGDLAQARQDLRTADDAKLLNIDASIRRRLDLVRSLLTSQNALDELAQVHPEDARAHQDAVRKKRNECIWYLLKLAELYLSEKKFDTCLFHHAHYIIETIPENELHDVDRLMSTTILFKSAIAYYKIGMDHEKKNKKDEAIEYLRIAARIMGDVQEENPEIGPQYQEAMRIMIENSGPLRDAYESKLDELRGGERASFSRK